MPTACARDLDDLFAYTTSRRVRIRHRYVGGIHYLLMLGIFGWVIGYMLIYKRGYLELEPISGSIDVIIQAGRHEGARGITEFFLPGQTTDLNLDTVDGRGNKSPSVAAE